MADDPALVGQCDDLPANATKEQIVAFARTASLEVTMPTAEEIDAVVGYLPAATEVFLSDVPRRSPDDAIRDCARLTAAGLVPVPHIAVRGIDSILSFERLLDGLAEVGGVRKTLLVSGDREPPLGPYADVAAALRGGTLERAGMREIAIAGYPDGHPRIATGKLDEALAAKLALLEEQGLGRQIVTQFGFEPEAIERWILQLRRCEIPDVVSIGVAGPASASALLKFAMRCGVRTSVRGLVRGGIGRLLTMPNCDRLIGPLTALAVRTETGKVKPHFFSFGGAVRTARWIGMVQAGRFEILHGGEIRTDPPA